MLTQNTRILNIAHVSRTYNGRASGYTMQYGSEVLHDELIYKWSGASISTLSGQPYALSEGSLLYLPKGFQGEYTVQTLQQGEAIDIFCDLSIPLSDHPILFPPPHRPIIQELFASCYDTWHLGDESRMLNCLGYAYRILAELQTEEQQRPLSPVAERALRYAFEYLTIHCFDAKLNLPQMVQQTDVSYSYLKTLFIREVGMPPSRYVTLRRMEAAKDLLQSGEVSISEIGKRVGYGSVYYFSRVFSREVGMTPTAYRNSMR